MEKPNSGVTKLKYEITKKYRDWPTWYSSRVFCSDDICPNCKFPICVGSDSCKNGRWHSKLECNILAGNPQLFESGEFLMFFSFLSLSECERAYLKLLPDAIFTRNFNFQSQQNLTFKFIRQLYMSFALYNCKDLTVRQKDASKDEI